MGTKEIITNQFVWTHLVEPTIEEIESLHKKYNFHELIMEDLLEMNGENKVEYYDDTHDILVIMMNFPKYDIALKKYVLNTCVILLNKEYVISATRIASDHLTMLFDSIEVQKDKNMNTFDIVYDIIDSMYNKTIKSLAKTSQEILKLEETIVYTKNVKRELLEELLSKKINMITLSHMFKPQREILQEIKKDLSQNYVMTKKEKENMELYMDDIAAKGEKIINNISVLLETVGSLTETYDGLLRIQANNMVTALTMLTAVTGTMSVVVGAFGMNVSIPGSHIANAFWRIMGTTLGIIISIIILGIMYKYKK